MENAWIYSQCLESFSKINPELTFKLIFPLLSEKLITKGKFNTEKFILSHIIEENSNNNNINTFTFAHLNKKLVLGYLKVLEGLLKYGRIASKNYFNELETLILLYL